MVQQNGDDWIAALFAALTDGGNFTASEGRTVLQNLRDSVAFAALSASLEDGQLMRLGVSGGLMSIMPAPLSERASGVRSTMPLLLPSQEILRAGSLVMRGAGGSVFFDDDARNTSFTPVVNDATIGAGLDRRAQYGKWAEALGLTPTTVGEGETFSGTTLQFMVTNGPTGTAQEYRNLVRAAGASEVTGCNITIRTGSHTGDVVFDYQENVTGGAGFTMPGGASETTFNIDLLSEYVFFNGEQLYITITGDGSTDLQLKGETVGGETIPHFDVWGRSITQTFLADAGDVPSDEHIRDLIAGFLVAGTGISIVHDDNANTLTITANGATPTPGAPDDLRYGLSSQSDPALVDFATLTDVGTPTDPITVSTGTTTAGQYFHIFSANTHDIQTITDTVLSQIVYQDGGTGNIFTKTDDSRTVGGVTFDAYTIGPLNAGVDEEYIVRFS